jgi:hypothetical protein
MTPERELTEAVDLCTPDGSRLNPAARGWSRRPLHRCNLDDCFGANKRWDYWAVLAGDLVVSCVYANLDTYGLADVWWADLARGESGGHAIVGPGGDAMPLPERPGTAPLRIDRDGFGLALVDDTNGTRLTATWPDGNYDLFVALPARHESLNVVIPWSDERFNFTSKQQARPARGTVNAGGRQYEITGDAWGVLDVGRGRWPSPITWNWGGGAGRTSQGAVIGLQFGAKWTAGTGFTENGFLVGGRLTKLGHELEWEYDWDAPMQTWRVRDPGGQLDVALTPRFDKHTAIGDERLGSEVHQVFGTWDGHVRDDDGAELSFDGLQGFAEEARQRW